MRTYADRPSTASSCEHPNSAIIESVPMEKAAPQKACCAGNELRRRNGTAVQRYELTTTRVKKQLIQVVVHFFFLLHCRQAGSASVNRREARGPTAHVERVRPVVWSIPLGPDNIVVVLLLPLLRWRRALVHSCPLRSLLVVCILAHPPLLRVVPDYT